MKLECLKCQSDTLRLERLDITESRNPDTNETYQEISINMRCVSCDTPRQVRVNIPTYLELAVILAYAQSLVVYRATYHK